MARLAEPPAMSADAIEAYRKRLARQNRDLAKSNNWRGLRIRELEAEQSCLLSENLALQTRILELERELRDNHARRIADHALAIKAQLENQLLEFGSILEGLGMEPPPKRRSRSSRETRVFANLSGRRSSGFARPSPSQRRLRDVASQVEELGHIPENKSFSRRSMSSDQILALRAQAQAQAQAEEEEFESPELGPPPMSRFVGGRLSDSPPKSPSPHNILDPAPDSPTPLSSPFNPTPDAEMETGQDEPQDDEPQDDPLDDPLDEPQDEPEAQHEEEEPVVEQPTSPAVARTSPPPSPSRPDLEEHNPLTPPKLGSTPSNAAQASLPLKSGTKRKFNARDDVENHQPTQASPVPSRNKKRNHASSRALKEATKARQRVVAASRKPLAAKSTNEDVVNSPIKKSVKPHPLAATAAITTTTNTKLDVVANAQENEKPKTKLNRDSIPVLRADPVEAPATPATPAAAIIATPEPRRTPSPVPDMPVASSTSTSIARDAGAAPGTPPPALIEAMRPSRRARAAVSYAEPNLRDKMRRPGKELVDAVTGEAKNRRSSHNAATAVSLEQKDTCDEARDSAETVASPDNDVRVEVPASPPAEKPVPPPPVAEAESLPMNITTKRRSKSSVSVSSTDSNYGVDKSQPENPDTYDMPGSAPSSPASPAQQSIHDNCLEPDERPTRSRNPRRRPSAASKATSRKRSSMAAQHEGETERRSEARRRSMMM